MSHPRSLVPALLQLAAMTFGCSAPAPVASAPAGPALLGELKPVVSVKELMKNEIDPLSDNIFDAVGESVTLKGVTEIAPKSDEDWAKIRIGAVTLAEAVNLLKIPRLFAPPGDLNVSQGPDAPELSPDAIKEKVYADRAKWNGYAEALRGVAIDAIDIVNKRDVAALDAVSDRLDKACESCHLEYWYPGDRKIIATILERDRQKAEQEKRRAETAK
jgi:cytochrome c556